MIEVIRQRQERLYSSSREQPDGMCISAVCEHRYTHIMTRESWINSEWYVNMQQMNKSSDMKSSCSVLSVWLRVDGEAGGEGMRVGEGPLVSSNHQ